MFRQHLPFKSKGHATHIRSFKFCCTDGRTDDLP